MAAAAWAEPEELLAGEEPLVLLDPEAGHAPTRVAAGGTPAPRIRQVKLFTRMSTARLATVGTRCRLL